MRVSIFTILLITLSSFSQNPNHLIGDWESVEDESSEDSMIIGGSDDLVKFKLSFSKDGIGYDFTTEEEFEYVLEGKILKMGDSSYEILRLTKKELVLKEVEDELSLEETVIKFSKIDG